MGLSFCRLGQGHWLRSLHTNRPLSSTFLPGWDILFNLNFNDIEAGTCFFYLQGGLFCQAKHQTISVSSIFLVKKRTGRLSRRRKSSPKMSAIGTYAASFSRSIQ